MQSILFNFYGDISDKHIDNLRSKCIESNNNSLKDLMSGV